MAEKTIARSRKPTKKKSQRRQKQKRAESPHSWGSLRSFFSCKDQQAAAAAESEGKKRKCKRIGCSGSLCNTGESSRVMQRPEANPSEPHKVRPSSMKDPKSAASASASAATHSAASLTTSSSSSSSSVGGSFRGMHLRRLSGCYECHMVLDPLNGLSRVPSVRVTVLPCPDCGEIFVKSESLELHQAVRHAVSELGPEDSSRNIVEIIFQSSWLKKQPPVCKIDRILKVHNTQKTVSRFEDYRSSIKNRANKLTKKHPRCIADGNELLRFHCTSYSCSLGLNGSTNLCHSIPHCSACSIIRDGFKVEKIRTLATSGRAHDAAPVSMDDGKRAMLVCRVIAGRVKKNQDVMEEFDSIAGIQSNMDELFVFSPRAILPCFVVVYGGF